jgi:hypothetical protein
MSAAYAAAVGACALLRCIWHPAREPSAAVYSVLAFSHAAMNVRALAAISSGPSPGE